MTVVWNPSQGQYATYEKDGRTIKMGWTRMQSMPRPHWYISILAEPVWAANFANESVWLVLKGTEADLPL